MIKLKVTIPVIASVILILGNSCREEFSPDNYDNSIEWTPTFQGPVASGSLTLEDLLNRIDSTGLIESDSTGLINFAYRGSVEDISASEWLNIPAQEFKQVLFESPIEVADGLPLPLPDTSITISDDYHFVFANDERIDSILLERGSINIVTSSSLRHAASVYISSPNIILSGGDTLDQTVPISNPTGSFDTVIFISMDGGKLYLDNRNPDTSWMPLNFTLEVNWTDGVGISQDEGVEVTLSIGELRLESAFGSVGTIDTLLITNEEIEIDLFNRAFTGTVSFADPRMKMTVRNSFGLPIGFGFENVKAFFKDGSNTDLVITPPLFVIDAPGFDQVGESVTSVISVSKQNSNINELFTTDLRKLQYSVRLATNPEEADKIYNYFLDTSSVAVDYEFELPMDLRVSDLVIQDTIDFDLSGQSDQELDINALEVKIVTDNGMPLDVGLQVYFVDSAYLVLDSLYSDGFTNVLEAGQLDADGKVIAPTTKESSIDLTTDKIDKILESRYAFVSGKVVTANNGNTDVKIYSDYGVDFKLGTRVDLVIKTKDE